MTTKLEKISAVVLELCDADLIEAAPFFVDECKTGVIICLLEDDGHNTVHEKMKLISDKFFEMFGEYPQISHNSPTDGNVYMALEDWPGVVQEAYCNVACCKGDLVRYYEEYKETGNMSSALVAWPLKYILELDNPDEFVANLDPDEDFLKQLIIAMH